MKFSGRRNYKPSSVFGSYLSKTASRQAVSSEERNIGLLPCSSCCGLGLHRLLVTQETGGLLPRRFTFTDAFTSAVYFLLHYSLASRRPSVRRNPYPIAARTFLFCFQKQLPVAPAEILSKRALLKKLQLSAVIFQLYPFKLEFKLQTRRI